MEAQREWLYKNMIKDAAIVDGYFIGRYPVMFGERLRAGKMFSGACDIDVCCGDSKEAYDKLRLIYGAKIERNRKEGKPIFSGLREKSDIKPYFNDPEFVEWLTNLS